MSVDRYERRDAYANDGRSRAFRPMLLCYLWRLVEDEPSAAIPRQLADQPEFARAVGFDPTNPPGDSTFRPVKLRERFADLESTLERATTEIREIAARNGSPIGYALGREGPSADTAKTPSPRTKTRLIRKHSTDVLQEMRTLVFPSVSLSRPADALYDEADLLELETVAAIHRVAANAGGSMLGNIRNPDPDPETDPITLDGPSGEVLLDALKGLSVGDITGMMNAGAKKTITRALPRLQELEQDGFRLGTRATLALDITYVAYYGERDELTWVQGAPPTKEYTWCYKFATAALVGENYHFIVGVCPLGSAEYAETAAHPGADQSYYIGDVVRRLLSYADDIVTVGTVYADREFAAADVFAALEDRDVNYVIPAIKDNSRVGPMCDRFEELKRGHTKVHDTPLYVNQEYAIYGPVKHGVTNERRETNLVILPPDQDDPVHAGTTPQPFFTNLDLSDETALDRRYARTQIEAYSDRAAIENSYASVKKAAAWTTSKAFEVRWFHFGFACLLYNMWLVVDFLTKERIGVIETRRKPELTLTEYLDKLDNQLKTFI